MTAAPHRMPMFSTFSRRAAFLLCCTLLWLASACNSPKAEKPVEPEDPNLPPAQVDLPSPPPASAFDIPETNPDGTLRVEGLIQFQDKHLGKKVRVRGVITQILGDCDPAKAKKENTPCPQPHFIIKDNPDDARELMVVGFSRDFLKKAKVQPGESHVFEGDYTKIAQQFVNSESGLVLLDQLDETSVLGK